MIRFDIGAGADNSGFNYANRRAAWRQTEEQREQIRQKYNRLIGTLYRTPMQANDAAERELDSLEEYWDEDRVPRRPLNITSDMFSSIVPMAGGAMLYFRSNPSKGYFYPSAGTVPETAKRVSELVTSPDLEKAFTNYWAAMNGGLKR
jgi:hypothetical protein